MIQNNKISENISKICSIILLFVCGLAIFIFFIYRPIFGDDVLTLNINKYLL